MTVSGRETGVFQFCEVTEKRHFFIYLWVEFLKIEFFETILYDGRDGFVEVQDVAIEMIHTVD